MAEELSIQQQIALGEDSKRQFKVKLNNVEQVAVEMCAMSNSLGGDIFVGVADDGEIVGISAEQLRTYNQWISSAADQLIRPAVYPQTISLLLEEKMILQIKVPEGSMKPYSDNKSFYWIKSGSDKRKASPQELARMFQSSSQITLDEIPTTAEISSIDKASFLTYFEKKIGQQLSDSGLSLEQALNNMNLAEDAKLTLAGLLLFNQQVQNFKPFCLIKAVAYTGEDIADQSFIDRRDCQGTLQEQFRSAMSFLQNNLKRVQSDGSFNQRGKLEIAEQALEEVLVNALLHRDYSKNAAIRLLIFKNRVEIISPGSLPNHLTIENIKSGNSVMRNPILASHGAQLLPYSGIGSGILRILKTHPETTFNNDREGEQFTVVMERSS